jgi:predicted phage-related endonuclease
MLTEEQKAKRKGKITSSIAAAALGLNQMMSPIQAALSARGEDDDFSNKATERGTRLEQIILEYSAEKHGLRLEPAPFRQHPVHAWAGDSADACYYKGDELRAIGEGKSAGLGVAANYGEESSDDIPNSVLVQSHWHLAHWPEVDVCYVPVLVGGYTFEFREYVVHRDDEFLETMFADLEEWHKRYVIGDELPPATAGDDDWLKGRYPKANGNMIADNEELAMWASRKVFHRDAKKTEEKLEAEASSMLKQLIGDSDGVKASWGKATWTNNKSSTKTNYKAIVEEMNAPDELIQKHTIVAPGPRVLRVTLRK